MLLSDRHRFGSTEVRPSLRLTDGDGDDDVFTRRSSGARKVLYSARQSSGGTGRTNLDDEWNRWCERSGSSAMESPPSSRFDWVT